MKNSTCCNVAVIPEGDGPSGEIRYNKVSIPSSRNRTSVHRTLVFDCSNLPSKQKRRTAKSCSSFLVRVGRFDIIRCRFRRAGIEQVSTGQLYLNVRISIEKKRRKSKHSFLFSGPSGEIRTPGILNPNQAPYQLGHTRKYKIAVLSDGMPYSRLSSALSICKQN